MTGVVTAFLSFASFLRLVSLILEHEGALLPRARSIKW